MIKKIITHRSSGGAAFIIFGSNPLRRFVDLGSANGRVVLWGNTGKDYTGWTTDVFDFDGDGSLSGAVAPGGHYPFNGWYENVGPAGYDEHITGQGPFISYSEFCDDDPNDGRGIVILPDLDDINYDNNPEMSWFKA